ncbi:hypothetical protein ILUMI_08021 [Ignelater luminosus]|uniref:Peptidase S1 domain-containing protein n=1 Tax=Ignelater luminosus TaxID=2038154 RepID=A0A8K0D6E1_IGNLU|nr:hypothetical protein ILUMI_08021 [Ignelater luminosus]
MFRLKLPLLCILLYFSDIIFSTEIKSHLLPDRDVCGQQLVEQRIYGGEAVDIGEFPWLALLGFDKDDFVCGGSLINNRYVLTAAHCISDELALVRLGEHNIKTDVDCEGDVPGLDDCSDPPVDIEIEEKIVHEDYDNDDPNFYADIALIKLKKEVNYTEFISPLCLPLSSELSNKMYTEEKVVVAGWGKTKTKLQSEIKLKVELLVQTNNDCSKHYRPEGMRIAGSQMCAGGEKGKDSCSGDSGGPLMYHHRTENELNWICVGIVSYGLDKCGIESVPGVYTRVTEYLQWILDHMEP